MTNFPPTGQLRSSRRRRPLACFALGAWALMTSLPATSTAALDIPAAAPAGEAAALLARGDGGGHRDALGSDGYGGGGKKFDAYGKNDPYAMKGSKAHGGEDGPHGGGGSGHNRGSNHDGFGGASGGGRSAKSAKASKAAKNGNDSRYDDDGGRGNSDREDSAKPPRGSAPAEGSGDDK